MSPATDLRRRIEGREIVHPEFLSHYEYLDQRIVDALDGYSGRIEWLVGPTRVGKTMLIKALARAHPETRVEGRRHVPVLVVPVPPNISPLLLPISVLQALGIPLPPRGLTSGVMFNRLVDQLRLAGTRVLLFEEASHLVELSARLPPRAAGDWFKALADQLDLSLFLFGVPRLRQLFESNEQLRLRASAPREFMPYDSRDTEEQKAFASCVRTYADLFREAGWPIEVPLQELAPHCYLLTGGLVGTLTLFMQELAAQVVRQKPRPLTFDDCALAAENIQFAGDPRFPAFVSREVKPPELHAAYLHVLELDDLPIPQAVGSRRGP